MRASRLSSSRPNVGRDVERGDNSAWVVDDVDEVDAAEGGAQLILDAGFATEPPGFHRMRLVRDLIGGAAAGSQPIERAEQGHDYCG